MNMRIIGSYIPGCEETRVRKVISSAAASNRTPEDAV